MLYTCKLTCSPVAGNTTLWEIFFVSFFLWHEFLIDIQNIFMSKSVNKGKDKKGSELRNEARTGGEIPGRNTSEKSDIEQTRIENRREADLDDKTPAGDAGAEDNNDQRQADDPIGETNY